MSIKNKIFLVLSGSLIGFINGFFGGGGGMVAVPALTLILNQEQKVSHATALAVILPVTLVSVIAYFISGKASLQPFKVTALSIAVTVGGVIGALILKKINNKALCKIFAVLMLIAGVKMVVG